MGNNHNGLFVTRLVTCIWRSGRTNSSRGANSAFEHQAEAAWHQWLKPGTNGCNKMIISRIAVTTRMIDNMMYSSIAVIMIRIHE